MKAIGFFLTVFLSMLAVFLVATGEVKRWFTPEAPVPALELGQVKVVDQRKPGAGNIFEFPFYDVDRAELKFVIRAEFIQDELGVSSQIDKIDHLTLRNGVIEVPLADGGGEGADRAVDEVRQRTGGQANRLLLEFQTASYERGQKDPSGKSGLAVFLKNGKGTTDDGTQFFFEELAFGNKGPDVYYLRSQKPVSIRGQAFGVLSPTGLDGTLRQRTHQDKSAAGATDPLHQELLLLPPVSALLHPEASLAAFDPGKKGSAKPEPAATTPPKEGGRVVGVTSQGPLSIVTQDGAQGTASRVEITFEKDVAVYPAPEGATLETLPAPQGSRFDCQKLTVQLETVRGRTEPVRAVATWEGGRVRAHFASSRGGEQPFVIEGDPLEWNRKPGESPPGAEAAAHVGRGNLLDGVAVLQGKPILRTRGLELLAERTSYFPAEGKLWLSKVSGTLEYLGGEEKEGRHSKKPTEEKLGNLGVGAPGPGPGPAAAGDGDGVGSPSPSRAPGSVAARVPQFWDLGADEAEIYFSDAAEGEGRTAGERIFSRLVARSERSDGVRVSSRGERSYQAVGAHLTYTYGDKKATLEGTPQDRPRFTSGDNWIEAVKIHVFQEERAVWFEDEVLARVDDLSTLRLLARDRDAAEDGKASRAPDRQAAQNDGLEISAAFLAVRFREESSADAATPLRDLVATGTRERPVSLTTLSTPWCRFSGRELHWDQEKETARLRGAAGAGAVPLSSQAPEELARIQVDGGEILAPDLVFHQKTWKAYLGDTVLLKSARQDAQRGRPVIQVETGKAEVELYRGLVSEGPKRAGQLGELGRVRSLKATHPANGAIVVSGAVNGIPYSGKAEEATWTQETRVFRLHGTNFQEVVLEAEGLHGPTLAREILFDESQSLVTLRGDVRGTLVQKQGLAAVHSAGQETGAEKAREVTWTFETNALEAKVIPATGTTPAALESLRARDKVDLRCDDLGIQLRGDDMIYEEATHKVRVFSPDGRPQTLVCDATRIGPSRAEVGAEATPPAPGPAEGRPSDAPSEKVHKVVAQEISLLLYRDPYAVEQRGEIANWLLVELEKDVIASFYIPGKKDDARKSSAVGEIWKMVAERLTLFVDPAQGLLGGNPSVARKAVPWAAATGKVVFTTGTLQATADRAIYQESSSRVTLYGSPARLSKDNEPVFAEPEISVWREDGSFGARYSKGDGRAPRAPAIPAPTGNKPAPGPEPRRSSNLGS